MIKTKNLLAALVLGTASAALSTAAWAQHADIEISVVGGALSVSSDDFSTEFGTGYKVFESDLSPLGWRTDDPGFEVDDGVFAAGDNLWYRGLDLSSSPAVAPLRYWNGTSWGTTTPNNETFRIEDQNFPTGITRYTTAGITGNRTGFISDADSQGGIHQHIDFYLERSGGTPANGLYLIPMQLYSPTVVGGAAKYGDSMPFYLAFNLGLTEMQADAALSALAVPEPETYAMMAIGLVALALGARRRRDQHRTLRA